MDVYVFDIIATPTPLSPEYDIIQCAYVDIWVYDSSREHAEIKAQSYLMDLGWKWSLLEKELVLNDVEIEQYREDAQANYYQAKQEGVSVCFMAEMDSNSNLLEVLVLQNPVLPVSTSHN